MASTNTWQLPAAAYMTGTVACSLSAAFSPSPPRGMIRSTSAVLGGQLAQLVAVASGHDRHGAAGIPPPSAADTTWASTAFECAAIEDPRSTIALPDLRQSAEQSTVTFGRAS